MPQRDLRPDIKDVEVGIDRVWAMHRHNRIKVFDSLEEYRDEKLSYSRELDDNDEPTEKIEDKSSYHLMDAERYIMGYLNRKGAKTETASVDWRAPREPVLVAASEPRAVQAAIDETLDLYDYDAIVEKVGTYE